MAMIAAASQMHHMHTKGTETSLDPFLESRVERLESLLEDLIHWRGVVLAKLSPLDALSSLEHKSTVDVLPVKDAKNEPIDSKAITLEKNAIVVKEVEVAQTPAVEISENQIQATLESSATNEILTPSSASNAEFEDLASRILDVIKQYGQHLQTEWAAKPMFLSKVAKQVATGEPIKMILPAFPWKSINRTDKVLSHLPDLGEKLALGRLNELCVAVKNVYPPGGIIHLATDGLLFDDVVGISDDDTWAYSEELMRIAKQEGYHHIKLIRAMEILKLTGPEPMTKDVYLSLVAQTRATVVEKYGRTKEDVREMMDKDPDTLLTYRGFIRFLETDLKNSPVAKEAKSGHAFRRCVKEVAIQMMIRAESFTELLKAHCDGYVRLSIHPSSGSVKLSVPLIPQKDGSFPKTPWHSCIAMGLDGSFRTCHSKDVRETHNLITHEGRPYYYRERSELWDWDNPAIVMQPEHDGTLIIKPSASAGLELAKLSEEEITKLTALRAAYGGQVKVVNFANAP